ncbi:5999_t:CDS:2, partial [Scutellospora calospora]
MSESDIRVVAAIDFGTTYSGFAYAHKQDPNEIYVNTDWQEYEGRTKTPTALQYNDNMKLENWGYPALIEKPKRRGNKNQNKHPVELFKLHLGDLGKNNKKPKLPTGLSYQTAITDYLTEITKSLKRTLLNRWPLLDFDNQIPAEFGAAAIATMRDCAHKAGLIQQKDTPNLLFTTEPEAAAVHCMNTLKQHDLGVGDTFMVVDCGGGTVDLTTRKLLADNKLSEITEREGDFCGGSYVDQEFLKYLGRKVGTSAIELVKQNHYGQLQFMVQEFCRRVKIPFTGETKNFKPYELDLEDVCPVLKQYVKGQANNDMEEAEWVVTIEFDDVKAMFDPVVGRIIRLIHRQLDKSEEDCSVMFLVGGFSESRYLQSRVRNEFDRIVKNIPVPPNPIAAIVKGAVQFGLKQEVIADRVLKWTYGTRIARDWTPDDPPERKNGKHIIIFERLGKKGDRVAVDEKVIRIFAPTSVIQEHACLDLYVTSKDNAEYCDEYNVNLLDHFNFQVPITGEEIRPILYVMKFGMVEIQTTAINV